MIDEVALTEFTSRMTHTNLTHIHREEDGMEIVYNLTKILGDNLSELCETVYGQSWVEQWPTEFHFDVEGFKEYDEELVGLIVRNYKLLGFYAEWDNEFACYMPYYVKDEENV